MSQEALQPANVLQVVRGPALVVFACVQNAGRSQMAEAFFTAIADLARARAVSAGTRPAGRVHPEVVAVMDEAGLDLSGARPQLLTEDLLTQADWLITMGCGDECPAAPGVAREDWPLPDPEGQPAAIVREIRETLRGLVTAFVAREGYGRT